MKVDLWDRAKEVYNSAVERPPAEREAFVAEACAGDESLRGQVRSMLGWQARAESFIESPALEVAGRAMATHLAGEAPADLSGRSLLHYRIVEKIGKGGMGEVYKAHDTHLDRVVAIKVLPAQAMTDTERRRRFVQEARVVSSLNHPNIIQIYDINSDAGVDFMAMEYVAGQPLDRLIGPAGLPLGEALGCGCQIAGALAAAHTAGIVHRDLKPANIMVDDGRVKLLDFGLAKLTQPAQGLMFGASSTESLTGEGRILGTVAYMSPEQAEGKPVDARSDIFSFGSVLYEASTGRRAFRGGSSAGTMSEILKSDPAPMAGVPHDLETVVSRCLRKDPARRFQTMADLKVALEELKEASESGRLSAESTKPARPFAKWVLTAAALLVLAAAAVFLIPQRAGPGAGTPFSDRKSASFMQLTRDPGDETCPSLSPDGKSVAYAAKGDIYLLRVGGSNPQNLTQDSPANDTQPAFSPDGESIAFRSEREGGGIYVMGATGESVRRIAGFGFNPAWSPDGKEIVVSSEGFVSPEALPGPGLLSIVNLANGRERRLGSVGGAMQPHWSPHNSRIAYWTIYGPGHPGGQRDIWTVRTDGTDRVAVSNDPAIDWSPIWSPDGRFLYFASDRGGSMNLWRVPIDEGTGRVRGEPEPVTTGGSGSQGYLTLSGDGRRIGYRERDSSLHIQKLPFDPVAGKVTGPPLAVTQGSRMDVDPAASPDGRSLAFVSRRPGWDICVIQTDGSGERKLTDDTHRNLLPQWSPDGRQIAFYSNRSGSYQIWTIHADGSNLRQISESSTTANCPVWSPDGSRIVYRDDEGLWAVDSGKAPQNQVLERLTEPLAVTSWSADGRDLLAGFKWMQPGIIVYSKPDHKLVPLTDFGLWPAWLADGRRLIFIGSSTYGATADTLFILDTQSRTFREIFRHPQGNFSDGLAVSPDNRAIYYSLATVEADLWLASLR